MTSQLVFTKDYKVSYQNLAFTPSVPAPIVIQMTRKDDGHFKYVPTKKFEAIAQKVHRDRRLRKEEQKWKMLVDKYKNVGFFDMHHSDIEKTKTCDAMCQVSFTRLVQESREIPISRAVPVSEEVSDKRRLPAAPTVRKREDDKVTKVDEGISKEFHVPKTKLSPAQSKLVFFQEKMISIMENVYKLSTEGKIAKPKDAPDLKRRLRIAVEFSVRLGRNYLYQLQRVIQDYRLNSASPAGHGARHTGHRSRNYKLNFAHATAVSALEAHARHLSSSVGLGDPDRLRQLLSSIRELAGLTSNLPGFPTQELLNKTELLDARCEEVENSTAGYKHMREKCRSVDEIPMSFTELDSGDTASSFMLGTSTTLLEGLARKKFGPPMQRNIYRNSSIVKPVLPRVLGRNVLKKQPNVISARKRKDASKNTTTKFVADDRSLETLAVSTEDVTTNEQLVASPRHSQLNAEEFSRRLAEMAEEELRKRIAPILDSINDAFTKKLGENSEISLQKAEKPKQKFVKFKAGDGSSQLNIIQSDGHQSQRVIPDNFILENPQQIQSTSIATDDSVLGRTDEYEPELPENVTHPRPFIMDPKICVEFPPQAQRRVTFMTEPKDVEEVCILMENVFEQKWTSAHLSLSNHEEEAVKKYQEKFLNYQKSDPMYTCGGRIQPCDIVARVTDHLVDEILHSLAKEMIDCQFLQTLYDLEFQ